jgi:hypothetical protein
MTTLTSAAPAVIGVVDTHADVHVAAACDRLGTPLGSRAFLTTARGYRQLLAGCAASAHSRRSGSRAPAPTGSA